MYTGDPEIDEYLGKKVLNLIGALGFIPAPVFEIPDEIVAASRVTPEEHVLSVGGAVTPFYFLDEAKSVETVDIVEAQVEHMERLTTALKEGTLPKFVNGLIEKCELDTYETSMLLRSDLDDAIREGYIGINQVNVADKVAGMPIRKADIASYEPDQHPDVVYLSTVPTMSAQISAETGLKVILRAAEYLRDGARVLHTVFKPKEDPTSERYGDIFDIVAEQILDKPLKIKKKSSEIFPATEYRLLELNVN
jgi:hypothetical protein